MERGWYARAMLRFPLTLALVFAVACGGDDDASDANVTSDADATFDAPASDADTTDADTTDADTTDADTIDADTTDADTTDAPLPTDLGPVDCVTNSDCPGASTTCTVSAPGGVCFSCSDNIDCPDVLYCDDESYFTCFRGCADDDDCSDGKYCSTISSRCLVRSCSSDPCPYPYVCNASSFCERPHCSGGTCPAPMTCNVASDYCIEPAL